MSKNEKEQEKVGEMEIMVKEQAAAYGVVLINRSGDVRTLNSEMEWRAVLRLSTGFGWEPAGTEAPPHLDSRLQPPSWDDDDREVWGGSYSEREGEVVTVWDARRLGDGLRRALAHIFPVGPEANRQMARCFKAEDLATLVGTYGDDLPQVLVDLADFCHAGAFSIW